MGTAPTTQDGRAVKKHSGEKKLEFSCAKGLGLAANHDFELLSLSKTLKGTTPNEKHCINQEKFQSILADDSER